MMSTDLVLYSRQGCCLCEGLADRLRSLAQPPRLTVVDVDGDPELEARYGLEVPVLAVPQDRGEPLPLPRVSPRLMGDGLQRWLMQQLAGLS